MCFRGEDKQLVTLVVAGNRVDDDALLKELEDNGVPEDEEFFRKCLTGPFPKSAKYLLKRDLENCMLDRNMSSIIFEAEDEEVIIEIMRTYNKESWKIRFQAEGSNENLLHFFISRKFTKALSEIIGNDLLKEDVKELCFQKNAANKIPFMTILTGRSSSARHAT